MKFSRSFLILILILLVGCHSADELVVEIRPDNTTHFSGRAMTIEYHIIIGSSLNKVETSKIDLMIKDVFQHVDIIYNKWNPNSELSRLNFLKAGVETPLSPALESLLEQTQLIVELSAGKFDPTIEPLQQLWKTHLEKGSLPTDQEIAAIAPAIGWDKIHFGKGLFSKSHDLTKMDLGGIAKGLAVDLLVERLLAIGYKDLYVEWGGEIRCAGKHPSKRLWNVFISRLGSTDPAQAITMLSLDQKALATSGDYLQNWTIFSNAAKEEKRTTTFFHVFDPKTLRPLVSSYSSIASASVAAPSCALADGLATAAMMFPSLEEAETWAKQLQETLPDVSFWLYSRESAAKQVKAEPLD